MAHWNSEHTSSLPETRYINARIPHDHQPFLASPSSHSAWSGRQVSFRHLLFPVRDLPGPIGAQRHPRIKKQETSCLWGMVMVHTQQKYTVFICTYGQQHRLCPEEDAHFLSRITWWWQTSLIWNGWRRPLKYEDLADLNTANKSGVVASHFHRTWNEELEKAGWVRSNGYSCMIVLPLFL